MEEPRRLYRSNNGMIAGVCAGIANYFGWDPTLARIGFILMSIFTLFFRFYCLYHPVDRYS